jgi:hypothetical protein
MRHTVTLVFATLSLGTACGDSSSGAGGSATTTTTTGAPTGATSTSTASSTSATGSSTATGAGGGASCSEPTPLYDAKGCLNFMSASAICGFNSDKKICTFAVGCGFSTGDVSQCGINCEQGSSSFCNDATKTQCILDATCAKDCTKLAGCGFIL